MNAEQIREANINKLVKTGQKKLMSEAKRNQNDEFYTRLEDIQDEMKYHKKHFKGKVILMNCDDPKWSNFWKYFEKNQEPFGIKKLISTHYEPKGGPSYALIREKVERNGQIGYSTKTVKLEGNGDFRSEECIEFLKESDIVITNPPFSLFREFINKLNEYKKKYIIIGNNNAITYKETFKLIKDKRLWLGVSGIIIKFIVVVPTGTKHKHIQAKIIKSEDGNDYVEIPFGIGSWFTNIGTPSDRPLTELVETYNGYEKNYPKYDNFDAININKSKDIPSDYFGVMGVPITFLHKLNSSQFEIIGIVNGSRELNPYNETHPFVNGKKMYARLLIKRKGEK